MEVVYVEAVYVEVVYVEVVYVEMWSVEVESLKGDSSGKVSLSETAVLVLLAGLFLLAYSQLHSTKVQRRVRCA